MQHCPSGSYLVWKIRPVPEGLAQIEHPDAWNVRKRETLSTFGRALHNNLCAHDAEHGASAPI